MPRFLREFYQAILFLTIIPLWCVETNRDELRRSLAFFPLVGGGLGLILAGGHTLLTELFPPLVTAVLLILLLTFLTGALHLDGVADSADGLYGQRSKDERLRIMKDSRVGAMGVIALIALFALKIAALASIPAKEQWFILLTFPAIGRWMMVALAVHAPYARPEGGTGRSFVEGAGYRELLVATLTLALFLLYSFGLQGLLILLPLYVIVLGAERYSFYRLGGVTGDLLGAICEWSEALFLLGCSAYYFHP